MKNYAFQALFAVSLALLSGCETLYNASSRRQEADTAAMRAEMERQRISRDTEIARATAQSAEIQLQQMDTRISRLEDNLRQSNATGQADVAALQRDLASLRSETAASEVAKLLAAQQQKAAAAAAAARAEAQSQSGYEHKVQSGQTLSAIAQAYGVSVEKIKRANNLKNDVIRVGQTLFIPD